MTEDTQDISELIALLRRHNIAEFDLADGDSHFKIRLPPDESTEDGQTHVSTSLNADLTICSPAVGTLVKRHSLRDRDFVEIGQIKEAGDFIALIQVGSIFRPVVAPCRGVIMHCHCKVTEQVDYKRPLFIIRPL